MIYLKSRLFYIQLGVQVLFCAGAYFAPPEYLDTVLFILMVLLLSTLGVPHGANDFLYRERKSVSGSLRFLIFYLGSMAAYGVLWYFAGFIALIIFFIISIFHFGQANFEEHRFFDSESLLWGFLLVFWPVALSPREAGSIFSSMVNLSFDAPETQVLHFLAWLFTLAYFLFVWFNRRHVFFELLIQMLFIILWFYLVPLIPGFIIVFSLWHGLQSMSFQYSHFTRLNNQIPNSGRLFWINMILFSIISLLFLGIYIYLYSFQAGGLFILLSLITFPHVFVMHGLYNSRNKLP